MSDIEAEMIPPEQLELMDKHYRETYYKNLDKLAENPLLAKELIQTPFSNEGQNLKLDSNNVNKVLAAAKKHINSSNEELLLQLVGNLHKHSFEQEKIEKFLKESTHPQAYIELFWFKNSKDYKNIQIFKTLNLKDDFIHNDQVFAHFVHDNYVLNAKVIIKHKETLNKEFKKLLTLDNKNEKQLWEIAQVILSDHKIFESLKGEIVKLKSHSSVLVQKEVKKLLKLFGL